jgi:HAD superfamily hydrolase (TIGR01484 family)
MKRLIVFDLDGTLAESKSPLDAALAGLLEDLLAIVRVAVISGGAWPQFETQLLPGLSPGSRLGELFLLPTCGTRLYVFDDAWRLESSEDFTRKERAAIMEALRTTARELRLDDLPQWGDRIEDRGGQITLSALGQQAPLDVKKAWDPDLAKRRSLQARLMQLIPGFGVQIGGSTSIDVTRKGVDKAYGLKKLRDRLGIPTRGMIFVGDALFPGGNDHPAIGTGAVCIAVANPRDTKLVIETIIACLNGDLLVDDESVDSDA